MLMRGPADERTTMISVTWMKRGSDGRWCDLEMLDLKTVTGKIGVYVIWREGNPPRVVRIGQGDIASLLGAHRQDPAILAYRKYGKLRVTWAAVPAHQLDGWARAVIMGFYTKLQVP